MANIKTNARIFLIDDHPAVRKGLHLLLSQAGYTICGEAENSSETFERIGSSAADMALLDLSLGEENGLDLIAGIRQLAISVLVFSMHDGAEIINKAFDAGANGYVTKREAEDILLAAVSDLLAGKCYVSQRAAQGLANRALSAPPPNREYLLSERERQILAMLGKGESNPDIAAAFDSSIRTIETHYSRIIAKLELENMKELRRYAIRNISL